MLSATITYAATYSVLSREAYLFVSYWGWTHSNTCHEIPFFGE